MYRFEHSDNEWKEKGTGELRVMKHKANGKCRVLMRRDKTLKICANHLSPPLAFPVIAPHPWQSPRT